MATILLNMASQPPGKPTGVARFGIELSRRLIARGTHKYLFRSAWSREQLPSEFASGASLITIPPVTSYFAEVVKSSLAASSRFPAGEVDAIVNIDPLGLAAGGRRRLTIVHDLYYRALPELSSRYQRIKAQAIHAAVLHRSHAIVTVSHTTAADVRRFFPSLAGRVTAIHSDSIMAATAPGPLPSQVSDHPYVLAVANVTANKNFAVLAEAFGQIAQQFPALRLVHVGGDDAEVFQSVLGRYVAGDRLIRLQAIDDGVLASLYAHALCLCVPSLYEGFCLPIVEAQRLGCPVLFSNRSASGEIGGSGGIPFDPEDIKGLAFHLRRVIDDAALRHDLAEAGRRNVERFSWERAVVEYENVLGDLLT